MRFGFLFFLLVLTFASTAAEIKNLYVSEVDVPTQSPTDRNKAIQQALTETLIRITGQRDIIQDEAAREMINNGPRYVRQYRYLTVKQPEPTDDDPATEQPKRKIRVLFDSFALNEALRDRGFATWSADRPSILAWVAIEKGQNRFLFDPESQPELAAAFQSAARRQGLPLLLPLMDLTDQRALSFSDIWGNFDDRINLASMRYEADTVLTGRLLSRSETLWKAEWTLYQHDNVAHWSSEAGSATEALQTGVTGAFDLLAKRYVSSAGEKTSSLLQLRITGIHNLNDFARLVNYLKSLPLIEQVAWQELKGDKALFGVTAKGDEQALRQALNLSNLLLAADIDPGGPLHYRLTP